MNNKNNSLFVWGLLVIIYAVSLISIKDAYNDFFVIRCSVISSIVLLLLQFKAIAKLSGTFFTPCLFYLALYYIFQNGILLLFAIGADFNLNYINKFYDIVKDATVYSSISNVVAGYACLSVVSRTHPTISRGYIDNCAPEVVLSQAFKGFWLTGAVAIPLVLVKFGYARIGGYHAVRNFEESIPFVINFLEYLFVPFSVLCLVYSASSKRKLVFYTTLAWLLITAFCGDRTVGLSGILILYFINLKSQQNNTISKGSALKFSAILVILLLLVQVISEGRQTGDYSNLGSNEESALIHFVSELGFSSVNLFSMMEIVPHQENYLMGSSYIGSFISGLMPANADPTGFVRWIMQYRNISKIWINDYYDFSFGIGFSLNSESYINFGWFGLIMLYIINYVVFYFLNYSNPKRNPRLFDVYIAFVLLFLWCTLPRRDSYYIWKGLIYSIVIIRLYLRMFIKSSSR